MNKQKRFFIKIGMAISIATILTCSTSFASSNVLEKVEYTEKFKNWLQLTEEEKQKTIMPDMYYIPSSSKKISNNPLQDVRSTRASMASRFSLKDIISENVKIRNQQQTNSCWAFASLSSLETNLAMQDYKKGNITKIYDFSERHLEYATSKYFANNVENKKGYNRTAGDGGNFPMAQSYLTNGTGAITEDEMPFENNENTIDISEIQNKNVVTEVDDIEVFEPYSGKSDSEKQKIMNQIKEHIQNYGAVFTQIHGASSSMSDYSCYNNETGAKYCSNENSHPTDHAVSIIGWDDNYSIDNFAKDSRPSSNGAWIVRNSWGDKEEYTLSDLKKEIFEKYKDTCTSKGWNSSEEIPNEVIIQIGYKIDGENAYYIYGDNGYIYVSYEDANVSSGKNFGISKSSNKVNYDKIYQYDELYAANDMYVNNMEILLGNIFNRDTTNTEYLTSISINAPETYWGKVYVNPNGSSMAKDDLQLVELENGVSDYIIDQGYHTINFKKPIALTGNSFAVVTSFTGVGAPGETRALITLESKIDGYSKWDDVKTEVGKCFVAATDDLENASWIDLGKIKEINDSFENGDSTIKAFTTKELYDGSLKNIEIVTAPNKTSYFEGENFDKSGMVVRANYNSKDEPTVTLKDSDYSITNGTNLKVGQNSVTITFSGKSVNQSINVEKNSVVDLKIQTPPTKTEYKEGEKFDASGMVVIATYKDGTSKLISNYTITNGSNLKAEQTEITITFEGKSITQPITVKPNALVDIKVKNLPSKVKYVEGQNFDKTGIVIVGTYQDGSEHEIEEYTIENGEKLTTGQKSVTVSFGGKSVEVAITVEKKTITNIIVSKMPTKTKYIQNKEEIDLTGGKIKIDYNDNTSEEIDLKSALVKVEGFDNKSLGKNTLTVTYMDKTTTIEVEIIPEDVAENSNFDKMNANINSIKYFTFSDKNQKEYVTIDMLIEGIEKSAKNDNCTYYYYLSKNNNEDNIQNWVKITENQSSNDKLEFKINTKDIKNYEELMSSKTLYLYVREVAVKGGNQSVLATKGINMDADIKVETYLDNVKIENKNDDNKKTDVKDDTMAPNEIPQTGVKSVIIIILVIGALGSIFYIRYKQISKYVK